MDKLSLLRGAPYEVNQYITISQPTIAQIADHGEDKYWQLVSAINATSYDYRFQLYDMGIDYEDIDDFTVFCMTISQFTLEDTSILFGDFSFNKLKPTLVLDEISLIDEDSGAVVDSVIYELIVGYIRQVHGVKRTYRSAGNAGAREYYFNEERRLIEQQIEEAAKKGPTSMFEPLISSLVNCGDFKYDYDSVWQLRIYQFMDAVKRIKQLYNYKNLMTGIYTGNIDPKSISDRELNWMGEL